MGAQGHVFTPKSDVKKMKTTGVVKMANGSTFTIYKIDDYTIKDEVGNEIRLQRRRVLEDIAHPIISLTQLMKEG